MAKIQGHDFNIGASIRVFPPKSKAVTLATNKGTVFFSGSGVKVVVNPTSGEKTFMDAVAQLVSSDTPTKLTSTMFVDKYLKEEDTSYNAYTGKPVSFSTLADTDNTGDVIIDWAKEEVDPTESTHFEACTWLAKTLDQYLGLASILWDNDVERRKDRGAPGTFIPTSTGMKYRTLSNLWTVKPQFRSFVYNNTLEGVKALFDDENTPNKEFFGEKAEYIIRSNDKKTVSKIFDFSGIKAPSYYREKLGIAAEAI